MQPFRTVRLLTLLLGLLLTWTAAEPRQTVKLTELLASISRANNNLDVGDSLKKVSSMNMDDASLPDAAAVGGQMSNGPSGALLYCLCQIESVCNATIGCHKDPVTLSCGPLQIKNTYWNDATQFAGKPIGKDWLTCTTGARSIQCSWQTVLYYMARYAQRCTGARKPTDQDYARVHNGGPMGCTNPKTVGYWNKVKACMLA